jgi:hypothetical protein
MTLPLKRAFTGDASYSKEKAPKHPRIDEDHEKHLESTAGANYREAETIEQVSEPHNSYSIVQYRTTSDRSEPS